MEPKHEKLPNPKELEKEIGEFLAKKFGDSVKIVSPVVMAQAMPAETPAQPKRRSIDFDLKPEELIAYLDQYIVKQGQAKAILATKICTHFNRIKRYANDPDGAAHMVGAIKHNVLMIGPTGVGKTYMVKLIADRIGVPFVKGDATKFSETGYVGGDVEDLVRDLVREADDDLERAQYGIIYIDEIDKIAGSRNLIGADVSRTGVQRGLLKPMEETEVDLKVPHDPISMLQEIERFRKTGTREKRSLNTRHVLFIMSGAFADLTDIIRKRLSQGAIGFGAPVKSTADQTDLFSQVRSEDLIEFGFESEFVGRLPVRAVFERLAENDLFDILQNPNNPIILGKKQDFAAYGIRVAFEDQALRLLAQNAYAENTGARGLVSAVERALLPFERRLPSTQVRSFPVTRQTIQDSAAALAAIEDETQHQALSERFNALCLAEQRFVRAYLEANADRLGEKFSLTLTPARIDTVAAHYVRGAMDVGKVVKKVKTCYDQTKQLELQLYKEHDLNIVLEEDAVDFLIEKIVTEAVSIDVIYKKICDDFVLGLKLARDKAGKNRFFISKNALINPEGYIAEQIKKGLGKGNLP